MKKGNDINRRRLIGDWQMLCQRIGERLAGTQSELRAATYIEKSFKGAGLQDVRMENFPCTSLQWANTKVETQHGRRWSSVPSRSLVGAPATPGGMAVEGEMQWLEMPENAVRLKGELEWTNRCYFRTIADSTSPPSCIGGGSTGSGHSR